MRPVPNTKRREPISDGRRMTCPRCKKKHDILAYVPLKMMESFAEECAAIYKCPSCRWLFAPVDKVLARPPRVHARDDADALYSPTCT